LFTEVVHSHKHTYESSSYSSLDWVLSQLDIAVRNRNYHTATTVGPFHCA